MPTRKPQPEPQPEPEPRRKRWRVVVLALALVPLTCATLAVALARSPAARELAAQSLRRTIGPPSPPPLLIPPRADPDPVAALGPERAPLAIPLAPAPAPEPAPAASPPPRRPADLAGVSFVLLLGADNRSERVTGRTDTIMVAAFRARDGAVAAFSVPRDLWVPLPDLGSLHAEGRTHARISSVVRVGEVRLGRGQGLPLLRQVLYEQLGIRVDRYVRVDFAGFIGAIDALGGVEVDVDCPIRDCFWAGEDRQACTPMDIPAGRVAMDGATALAFARSRHGTGDHDRTRRQQAVVVALARKLQARGLAGARRLWDELGPYLDSDLGREDALYYASFAVETPVSEIGGFAIRHPMTARHVTEDGKHVLVLDRDAFADALAELFERELPANRKRNRCPAPDAALR